MTRDDILDAASKAVADRPDRYGAPEQAFNSIARAWEWYLLEKMGHSVPLNGHDVAIMMALLKVCRLLETPDHPDSWADIAGYAACGGEVAEGYDVLWQGKRRNG